MTGRDRALHDLEITEAAALLDSGSVSAVELAEACLDRTDVVEPVIRAVVEQDPDRIRARAKELDAIPKDDRGPLHGIPLGIKDVLDVAGYHTRAGSDVLADTPPASRNSDAVESLVGAGANVMGKVTTHEFAYGCETPPTRNPWDPERVAGGSSGGSAASVAAGESLGALGSDSGGSIRIPAALCGLTGLRPLVGKVSLRGVVPFSRTHDTVGPMGRSAADVALLWSVLSGEPTAGPVDPADIRFVAPDSVEDLGPFAPDVVDVFERAVDVLAAAGARRGSAGLPRFDEWNDGRTKVVLSEFLAEHTFAGWYPERRTRYSPELQRYFDRAGEITGADLILAHRDLADLAARFRESLTDADVLLLPTVSIEAPLASSIRSDRGAGITDNTMRLLQTTAPVSYTGLAAMSVPGGRSTDGLPLGIQVIGRSEATVLSVALAFQRLTDHHRSRPPVV